MILHHLGFIVKNIDSWEKEMVFEEKLNEVIDPIQHSRLALYKNYGQDLIELIQPLSEKSLSWNSLQKFGNHFNHFCYALNSTTELEKVVAEFRLHKVLSFVPAILFNNKKVVFYYARNKQVVEFLMND